MVLKKTYLGLNKGIGPFEKLEEEILAKGTWGPRSEAEQKLAGQREAQEREKWGMYSTEAGGSLESENLGES